MVSRGVSSLLSPTRSAAGVYEELEQQTLTQQCDTREGTKWSQNLVLTVAEFLAEDRHSLSSEVKSVLRASLHACHVSSTTWIPGERQQSGPAAGSKNCLRNLRPRTCE